MNEQANLSKTDPASIPQPKTPLLSNVYSWSKDKVFGGVIVGAMIVLLSWWWNSAVPNLRFSAGDVIKFSGEKEEFGIFVTTITNDGRKRAEQIRCEIELGESKIQDLKAGPPILLPIVEPLGDGSKAVITVPTLNATETLQLAIKATKPDQIRKSRNISVRGNDVVGVEGTKSGSSSLLQVAFSILMAIFSNIFGVYAAFKIIRRVLAFSGPNADQERRQKTEEEVSLLIR